GVDTTIHVAGYAALIDSARAALNPWRHAASLPSLLRASRLLGAADSVQRGLLDRAIATAAGVAIDGTADDGIVIPGERLQVEVSVWNAGDSTVRAESLAVLAPSGWTAERLELGTPTGAPGALVTRDVGVAVAPDELLWPIDGNALEPRRFTLTVTNRARGAAVTRTAVTSPTGWPPVSPESLAFTREDETKSVVVSVAPPAADSLKPGTYALRAGSPGPGGGGGGWLEIIDYPHIRPRALTKPGVAQIRAARVALPALSHVGYVRGAADRVPEALLAVGVPMELIIGDSLARGDLSHFDAIVIGSRAYETDPALVANKGRLLDYGRNGGLVIVQYQQYPFIDGGFAPYPLAIARPHGRVTDETAPVTELDPAHPVFHYPNTIGPADWRGWIQERGLYFAHTWDTTYVAVLETHDPGTPPVELK